MFHSLIFNVEGRSLSRNLGPYRIAHWLRGKGWDAEVIDYTLHWTLEELQELVESRVTKNTKFFGFSFLFGEWTDTIEKFAVWLKIAYPHIPIISGSSSLPKRTIAVDYHVWGFGETALDKLLMYLFSNGEALKFENIDGVKVINATLYPAYPLKEYSVHYEDRDFIQPWEFLAIETGRGCKFKCSFCNFTILGVKEDHSTSAESFEKQLTENWEKWGVTNYLIAEETLNDRPEKLEKFAKVVSNLNFDPWFAAFLRLDLMLSRKNEPQALKDMNVLGHFYGIESFNWPTAKAIRKGLAPEKVKEGLLQMKDFFSDTNRFRATISLIIGAPLESMESLHNTLDWLLENWTDQAVKASPLGIPHENKANRHSTLSTTYKDYGYKEVSLDVLNRRHGQKPDMDDIFRNIETRARTAMVWENPEMDIVQAWEFEKMFKQTIINNGFKKTTFALAEFAGVNATIDDKLSHSMLDVHGWQKEEFEWYSLYKFKKLCWTK